VKYFPYDGVRGGQRDFLRDCVDAGKSQKILLAHAPTGIGKTAAALSGALETAIEAGHTIFFLTPKHTQHAIVVDTIQKINARNNMSVKIVDIIGKQWMCPHNVAGLPPREFNEFCRAQKSGENCPYYNNTRRGKTTGKAQKIIKKALSCPLHNEQLVNLCSKHRLCPYEILLEAGKKADIIVCDYYHIFNPKIRRAMLAKLQKNIEETILIVDEAHNLPDRIRSIMSQSISAYTIKHAIKEAKDLGYPDIACQMRALEGLLKKYGRKTPKAGEEYVGKKAFIEDLIREAGVSYDDFTKSAGEVGLQVLKTPKRYRSHSKTLSSFLKTWGESGAGFARILEKDKKNIHLSHKCLDPGIFCAQTFKNCHSATLMSGTLNPLPMYSELLGIPDNRCEHRMYTSPFPEDNKLTIIVPGLTTKYSMRDEGMYRKYSSKISQLLDVIPGNCAIFYPSYTLAQKINDKVKTDRVILSERQDMKKRERQRIYSNLSGCERAVLSAVQAGGFSEGVDYPENLLDAVIIVGLPLEKPNLETQALIEYYDLKYGRGWDYGYIYPAMNRTLQAAGRCIRSESDRAAIILLDERYTWINYRRCLPQEANYIISEQPGKYLQRFYKAGEIIIPLI
jgi:DNA excision repair protein ERCC-2